MSQISRRDLVGVAATSLLLPSLAHAFPFAKGTLRVAHMTDFHVQPELNAAKGMETALHHAMRQKPDLVLCGGDLIMDGFAQGEARTALQWKIFQDLIRANVKAPIHYTLGNHDVWGWNQKDSHTTGSEAKWGKKWFQDNFGYTDTHHSFDLGGWHFVVLDNIWSTPDGYNGILGPAQLEWLDHDLGQTSKPTLVISHIPLLSVTTLVGSYNKDSGEWNVGGSDMTKDLDAVQGIFAKHPQVKIALSGHEHMVDRIDYKGVSYLCGGAVCGNWWNGVYNGFEPGYRLFDLHADGKFEERYVAWGWDKSYLG